MVLKPPMKVEKLILLAWLQPLRVEQKTIHHAGGRLGSGQRQQGAKDASVLLPDGCLSVSLSSLEDLGLTPKRLQTGPQQTWQLCGTQEKHMVRCKLCKIWRDRRAQEKVDL